MRWPRMWITRMWIMVVLPGGSPGTPNLAANKTVTETCAAFAAAGRKVAAICAAPSVLASLGLLEGRNATAHAGFQDQLAGAIVHDEEVVVDGNLTTSYGLGGAIPFALELVRQLAGQGRRRSVSGTPLRTGIPCSDEHEKGYPPYGGLLLCRLPDGVAAPASVVRRMVRQVAAVLELAEDLKPSIRDA